MKKLFVIIVFVVFACTAKPVNIDKKVIYSQGFMDCMDCMADVFEEANNSGIRSETIIRDNIMDCFFEHYRTIK